MKFLKTLMLVVVGVGSLNSGVSFGMQGAYPSVPNNNGSQFSPQPQHQLPQYSNVNNDAYQQPAQQQAFVSQNNLPSAPAEPTPRNLRRVVVGAALATVAVGLPWYALWKLGITDFLGGCTKEAGKMASQEAVHVVKSVNSDSIIGTVVLGGILAGGAYLWSLLG